jgi:hypothetical protein
MWPVTTRCDVEKEVNMEVQKEMLPRDIIAEMADKGMPMLHVMKLLSEMELIDENGENMWEENLEEKQDGEEMFDTDIMVSLPMEILPSTQDIADEVQQEGCGGFFIPELRVGQTRTNEDSGMGEDELTTQGQQMDNKIEGKKTKLGHMKAERRISRIRNDGRTSLEKAQDQKKKEDLEDAYNKGKSKKFSKILIQ